MKASIVPPGGFAGFSQMTQASQLALSGGVRSSSARGTARRRKRKMSAKASAPRRKKRKKASSRRTAARLVKGSRAAKAYMAKIRRKRKK